MKDKEYRNCEINDQLINQLNNYAECLNYCKMLPYSVQQLRSLQAILSKHLKN